MGGRGGARSGAPRQDSYGAIYPCFFSFGEIRGAFSAKILPGCQVFRRRCKRVPLVYLIFSTVWWADQGPSRGNVPTYSRYACQLSLSWATLFRASVLATEFVVEDMGGVLGSFCTILLWVNALAVVSCLFSLKEVKPIVIFCRL